VSRPRWWAASGRECSVVLELSGRWTLPQHVRFA
jgi:hypothetical protein